MRKVSVAFLLAWSLWLPPAQAQQIASPYAGLGANEVDRLTQICAGSALSCREAVTEMLATFGVQGLSPAEMNSAVASLAGAVNAAARRSEAPAELGDVLETLAARSSDPLQRENILRVAKTLAAGGPAPLAERPYAASPS